MLHPRRELLLFRVQRAEAEDIRDCYRLAPDAEYVPYDASHASRRSAERLDSRRVVVRLHLGCRHRALVELDQPCIVLEDREAPRLVEFVGRLGDVALEQVAHDAPLGDHVTPERLVDAVLRPRLPEGLQLDVRRRFGEALLECLHLGEAQRQAHLAADLHQVFVVCTPQVYRVDLGAVTCLLYERLPQP